MHHDFGETVRNNRGDHDWKALPSGRLEIVHGPWQGENWRHEVLLTEPTNLLSRNVCYIEVTGDDAGEPDLAYSKALAEASGVLVATMFQTPNQPLWNMVEDDLIAHTFEKYMTTGDPEWPLLVPMVRGVLATIDSLIDWSLGRFTHFVIGGASKRGWTAWMTAALEDPRVKGIVPVVFDNLNMAAQIKRQKAIWGELSPMLDDYTKRMLHDAAFSEEGESLRFLVDPYRHLARMRCPALVVNGTNDAYWAVDALSLYAKELLPGSATQVVPNLGHSIGDWEYRLSTFGAFVQRCAGLVPFPETTYDWQKSDVGTTISARSNSEVRQCRVWGSGSPDHWFADKEFFVDILPGPEVTIRRRNGYNQAVMLEIEHELDGRMVRTTSPVMVIERLDA